MAKLSVDLTNPTVNKIVMAKKEMAYQTLCGNCKQYKVSSQNYAKLAVDNFELAKKIPGIELRGHIPIKNKLNMLKILFFNFFRKKSTEEKQLKQMVKEYLTKKHIELSKP